MDLQPAAARRQRQRASARQAILDATESLLVEEGYGRLSIRRLVSRCGYSAPTIYHYFGDKQGLIEALLQARFALLVQRLQRVRTSQDPVQTLLDLSTAFVRYLLQHPTQYRMLSSPGSPTELPAAAEEAAELLKQPLLALSKAGRLVTDDLEANSQALWSLMHGVLSLRIGRPEHRWTRSGVRMALETLIRGMVNPSPESNRVKRRRRRNT